MVKLWPGGQVKSSGMGTVSVSEPLTLPLWSAVNVPELDVVVVSSTLLVGRWPLLVQHPIRSKTEALAVIVTC